MERRVVNVPVWTIIVGVAMMFGSPVLSVLAAVSISERNAERQLADVEQAKTEATAESKRITCAFFASSMDVYKENPPPTETGRAQYRNYAELYRITGCQPPRTK
jgi:hypothetical protein